MAVSNFTYGAGNPLNTEVDPFAIAAKDAAADPLSRPASELIYNPQYGNPLNMNARPIVATEENTNVQPSATKKGGGLPKGTPIATPKNSITKDDRDAFAQLLAIFESYDLGDLAATITKLMTEGKTASEALMLLKYDKNYNQAYTARFKGNADRINKGLNALSEAEYITNENAYAETLRAYGLNNMLSTDRKVNQAKFAEYISNDISSTEFNDRISTVVDNVLNADPDVMSEFKRYYGGLSNSDLVSYFLSPKENLPILKQKAAAAGISAESINQGLGGNLETRAMELSRLGVTAEQARTGYSNAADVLPTSQKLSSIYKEADIKYNKTTAENEFLLDNADAATKRKRLKSLERAQFGGSAGTSKGSFSTNYLNKQSSAGQF